uniref:Uncharacterized protein n=1 Tax=Anguilla anguilla TaxID=7936 RepID=A0A0E9XS50_ANGAN
MADLNPSLQSTMICIIFPRHLAFHLFPHTQFIVKILGHLLCPGA